jgi:hypothetical protein
MFMLSCDEYQNSLVMVRGRLLAAILAGMIVNSLVPTVSTPLIIELPMGTWVTWLFSPWEDAMPWGGSGL